MRVTLKNMPKLALADLLRRRKMTLRTLLDEFGITTYEGLLSRCDRMGVSPPSEFDFKLAFPDPPVNNPREGVVVLEAPPVVDELSGKHIDPEAPVEPVVKVVTGSTSFSKPEHPYESALAEAVPTEGTQKKPRKKKDQHPTE